jgi:hypothetical protein
LKTVSLMDGSYVSAGIVQVLKIPQVETSVRGSQPAQLQYLDVFPELLTTLSREAGLQDMAIELFCVSSEVLGQVYAAELLFYIVIRKQGRNKESIQASVERCLGYCVNALSLTGYVVKEVGAEDKRLVSAMKQLDQSTTISVEKQARVGTDPWHSGFLCYTGILPQEELNDFSRIYEGMTHYPNMAISFSLIPTRLSQEEISFVEGVNYYLSSALRQGPMNVAGVESVSFYRDKQNTYYDQYYLFGIAIMGNKESTSALSGRMLNALQPNGKQIGLETIDRTKEAPSYYSSFATFPWKWIASIAGSQKDGRPWPRGFLRMPYLMTSQEAQIIFHMPIDDGVVMGIPVNRVKATRETFDQGVLNNNNIILGRLAGVEPDRSLIGVPLNQMTRHTLIVGMPGTGKTTFSINLLLQLHQKEIPFLVIEPTKTEYRSLIDVIPTLQVFTPGKNAVVPFVLNPFVPPKGISLELFLPSLVSAFKAAFSMPSPLDILFLQAVNECYMEHGWRSYSVSDDENVKLFGLREFIVTFRRMIKQSNYSSEVKGNLESGGVFRLMHLIEQNGNIYDTVTTISLEDLLNEPTVIELNAIDNQEQKALLMALLLINIVLRTKHQQSGDGLLKNIMMIDEAHVLLSPGTQAGDTSADSAGTTVRALQNMIAEIRSYGTGLIIADQSPQKVTQEIVGNTSVKVIFGLVQSYDKQTIADSTNMSEEQKENLSRLKVGEAFVYFDGLPEPLMVHTENVRKEKKIRSVISDSEIAERMNYWQDKKHLLRPYPECKYANTCRNECDFRIRDDAKLFADRVFARFRPWMKEKKNFNNSMVLLEKNLAEIAGEELVQNDRFVNCVKIRYLKRAMIDVPHLINLQEVESRIRSGAYLNIRWKGEMDKNHYMEN